MYECRQSNFFYNVGGLCPLGFAKYKPPYKNKNTRFACFCWWAGMDSNHRSHRRQIYSLLPLAAREPTHDWSW